MRLKGIVSVGERKRKGVIRAVLLLVMMTCCVALTGCDGERDSIYDFAGVEPKEIDPWVYLKDTALSSSEQIINFASSASRLGITIGIIGIVFSILFIAIRILFAGSAKTRSEIKEEAMMKGLIAIMLFSIPLWLGICKLLSEVLV